MSRPSGARWPRSPSRTCRLSRSSSAPRRFIATLSPRWARSSCRTIRRPRRRRRHRPPRLPLSRLPRHPTRPTRLVRRPRRMTPGPTRPRQSPRPRTLPRRRPTPAWPQTVVPTRHPLTPSNLLLRPEATRRRDPPRRRPRALRAPSLRPRPRRRRRPPRRRPPRRRPPRRRPLRRRPPPRRPPRRRRHRSMPRRLRRPQRRRPTRPRRRRPRRRHPRPRRFRDPNRAVLARHGTEPRRGRIARPLRSVAQRLLVDHPSERGRHPGALVEAERARVVRRVDPQSHAALAALPEAPERIAEERRAHALPAPRATREEREDEAAAVGVGAADRPTGDLVAGADDAPERRVEALGRQGALRPRLEVPRRVAPVLRERLLARGVEVACVVVGVERDGAQAVRPIRCGWRRVELDAHLAEDAHGDVAERLEERAAVGVGLENGVSDRTCTAARRMLLEPGGDHRPDPAPERVGAHVSLGVPDAAALAHHAVADDACPLADDERVPLEVELGPRLLQIRLRERALAVQRRLERDDELCHRGRVRRDCGSENGALHVDVTLLTGRRHRGARRCGWRAGTLSAPLSSSCATRSRL